LLEDFLTRGETITEGNTEVFRGGRRETEWRLGGNEMSKVNRESKKGRTGGDREKKQLFYERTRKKEKANGKLLACLGTG